MEELKLHDTQEGIERAKAELASAKAKLDRAKIAVDECSLKAPQAGTVLRMRVGVGEVLAGQARQPIIQFCPKKPRLIRAEVDHEFASRVTVGQSVRVEDDVRGGKHWPGHVTRMSGWYTQRRTILEGPQQARDVRTLECLIALEDPSTTLRIGQRVRVIIGAAP